MNSEGKKIRRAVLGDEKELTELSSGSKRYWPYPEHFFRIWQAELTLSGRYLEENAVYLVEEAHVIMGYYSLVVVEKDQQVLGQTLDRGHWLDHMFVRPDAIGRGIGSDLFAHLCRWCASNRITTIQMLADPYARGFYEKMGCVFVREFPSTIEGRTTPLMVMDLLPSLEAKHEYHQS